MSFTRIQNETRQATERALDRYVVLLQQEKDWTPAEEAEMRSLGTALGKELPEMAADRQVIAKARELHRKIQAGADLGDRQVAARRDVQDFNKETENLIKQRRASRFQLQQAASQLERIWIGAQQARNDLVKLMRRHPLLLGDTSAVA